MTKRRTPPIPVQVVEADLKTIARIRLRLIDFDTNSSQLEEQHKQALNAIRMPLLRLNNFRVQLHGFGSKRGSAARNAALSTERVNAVLRFLQSLDNRVMSHASLTLENLGESASKGDEHDDSAHWRAVEVHIFDTDRTVPPPPPKPKPGEIDPNLPQLPGGSRSSRWEMVAPGAMIVGPRLNVILIKNLQTGEKRGYFHSIGGAVPAMPDSLLSPASELLSTVTNIRFTAVTPTFPVTWGEMESSAVTCASAAASGGKEANFSFKSSIFHYGNDGNPVQTEEEFLKLPAKASPFGDGFVDGSGKLVRSKALEALIK